MGKPLERAARQGGEQIGVRAAAGGFSIGAEVRAHDPRAMGEGASPQARGWHPERRVIARQRYEALAIAANAGRLRPDGAAHIVVDGLEVVFDAEWLDRLSRRKWGLLRTTSGLIYAVAAGRKEEGGRPISMHRMVAGAGPGQWIDHINRNSLDNRRVNLRLVDPSESACNRASKRNPTGYRGVTARTLGDGTQVFGARIRFRNAWHYLGTFPTAAEAARAYDVRALDLHGELAFLSFPEEAGSGRQPADGARLQNVGGHSHDPNNGDSQCPETGRNADDSFRNLTGNRAR